MVKTLRITLQIHARMYTIRKNEKITGLDWAVNIYYANNSISPASNKCDTEIRPNTET